MYEYAYAVLTNEQPDFKVAELIGFPDSSLKNNQGDFSDSDLTPDLADLANVVGAHGWRLMWIVSNGRNPVAYFEHRRL